VQDAKKIVDLVRLCRNIPGHLIACLIKEDPKFWVNDYLLHGIKLLFHLIRLGKKCHGDLEKQINRKVDLILDVCMFMIVSHIINCILLLTCIKINISTFCISFKQLY